MARLVSTMQLPATQDLIQKSFIESIYGWSGSADVRKLFIKDTQSMQFNLKQIQEIDRERFAEQKTEGAPGAKRGAAQGYSKQIFRKTISVTRDVTGEEYQALMDYKLSQYVMKTASDIIDKVQLDMANFLGYSAQALTTYTDNGGYPIDLTTGDSLSAFNTAHTLKNSTTTYSNILTGAPSLSSGALETAEDYFAYNVYDNYGQRMSLRPNTIITSRKAIMVNRVSRIMKSDSPEEISGTMNSNAGVINTYKNKYQHLVVEFDVNAFNITNSALSYYWFLAALGGTEENSLQWYYISWMSPFVAPAEIDQVKWLLSYTARSLYGMGAVSSRGIIVAQATA